MFAQHFSINNLPYGIISIQGSADRIIATRLEDYVYSIPALLERGLLGSVPASTTNAIVKQHDLNAFAALPKSEQQYFRSLLTMFFASHQTQPTSVPEAAHHVDSVCVHLPVHISGFTDFSCSKDHLMNAARAMGFPPNLPPGFLHFPTAYDGRASSIYVSGTEVFRPTGTFQDSQDGSIVFGPTKALDYELEMACIIGRPPEPSLQRQEFVLDLGRGIPASRAEEHIFGVVLLNDWSARDIQRLEMPPLGPFNGKNFATTISPWVVTLEALEPFKLQLPERDVPVPPHLDTKDQKVGYDITCMAELLSPNTGETNGTSTTLCESNTNRFYWSFAHLIAHQTAGGCKLATGDILATGTISGPAKTQHGCLMELTKGGKEAFTLQGGSERIYLQDGDTVRLSAFAGSADDGVGFGECLGVIRS
ncbi:fumarylacetoacetase [Cladophialophora bantiana CBS 173.52]|uniref:Fumarylacetoacetase n=1 Tax=Cladophialophora bantiana (strain ATCC 10958 / CBS 173.52 / CDC B-1940 / NIH 8579) TaxID=1442370 RepID=A0A0D2EFF9_CLAB1|nr:fumarylacetoacetase [Cladophialophora bantiana CBS 173.52]KIW88816.1 fumarylacetoacetase [Cladophialophora bantiana CBS 173.52]